MQGQVVTKFHLKDDREIVFRYPEIGDLHSLLDYINALSREQTFISEFQGEEVTLDHEEGYLKRLLQNIENQKAVQVLAFCGSQLVAVSDINMQNGAMKHTGIFGITVAKEFRGMGIGKKLMQLVLEEAIKNIPQLKILVLGCFSDNKLALNMYQKMGFQEYGILPAGLMHKDHFDDHIYMFKKI